MFYFRDGKTLLFTLVTAACARILFPGQTTVQHVRIAILLFACLLPIASAFAPALKVQPQDPRHSWVNRRTREISSAEVNVGLVRQLTLNQLLIGWTIWSGGEGAAVQVLILVFQKHLHMLIDQLQLRHIMCELFLEL